VRWERLVEAQLEIHREAFGCCSLLTPEAAKLLSELLDDTQAGRDYSNRRFTEDPALRDLLVKMGLPLAASPDEAPGPQWHEPARWVGLYLFQALCATSSPEGRPSVGALIGDFLDGTRHGPGQPPDSCICFSFALLPPHDPWRDALLALPWEALFEPERPAPLQIEHRLVIARSVDPYPNQKPAPLDLTRPVPALALIPRAGVDERADLRGAEERARPYRADLHAALPVWCDCPPPTPGLGRADLAGQLDRHRPLLLHYCGHGDFQDWDNRQPFSSLQIDETPLHATEVDSYLRNAPVWLFSCFACHSGTAGGGSGEPLSSDRWSLVNALGDRIPALLMMTLKITARAAGVAGEAWYQGLFAGETMLRAAHTMRHALWNHAQQQFAERDGYLDPNAHAWWIPALYLRHPRWNCPLVDHEQRHKRLMPVGEFKEPNSTQQATIDEVLSYFSRGRARVVVIHGEQDGASRTTLLHQIARQLESEGVQQAAQRPPRHLLVSAKVPDGHTAHTWLAAIRQAIIARLRQSRREHVHWSGLAPQAAGAQHEIYSRELAAPREEPFWVLIDDIDALTSPKSQGGADLGMELLRPLGPIDPRIRFIVTTREPVFYRLLTSDPRDPVEYVEKSIPVLYSEREPYTSHYDTLRGYLEAPANYPKRKILGLLMVLGVPVSRATLEHFGENSAVARGDDLDMVLGQLIGDGVLTEEGERYRLAIEPEIMDRWLHDPHPHTIELRNELYKWCDAWYEERVADALRRVGHAPDQIDLPDDLFRFIMTFGLPEQTYRRRELLEIVDYNFNQAVEKGELPIPYRWWLLMLKMALHYGHSELLVKYIERRLAGPTPYTSADTKLLHLLLRWLGGEAGASLANEIFGLVDEIKLEAQPGEATREEYFLRGLREIQKFVRTTG